MSDQTVGSALPGDERIAARMDGFFLPWVTDATALLADIHKGGRDKLRRLVLVQPTGVLEYEKPGVLFVAGDRGTGKSSVLLKKAVALLERDAKSYRTLRPHSPFVNELAQSSIAVPLQQYRRLSSPTLWELYWRLVLAAHYAAMTLRHRNVPHIGDAKKILSDHFIVEPSKGEPTDALSAYQFFQFVWVNSAGSRESLSPSMHKLVTAGLSEEDTKRWIEKAELVLADTLALDTLTQFTIFVDAIDEAVGSPGGKPLFRYLYPTRAKTLTTTPADDAISLLDESLKEGASHAEYRDLASRMWRHAQTGFMLAADRLWSDFSQRLWTYGAVRREAKDWYTDPASTSRTKQKVEGNKIVSLSYTAAQLAEIFALNVRHTPESELFEPVEGQPIGSEVHCLFGFDHVSHPRVLGEDERLLDLMIRHTFMAPRQLVGIARHAKQLQIEPRRRPQQLAAIMDAIDEESRVVFNDFVANVSPAWTSDLDALVLDLQRNVLTDEEVSVFEDEKEYPGFFDQLYSRGLVGIPKHNSSENEVLQYFLRPNGTEVRLDSPPYVFLHPALAAHIFGHLSDPDLQRAFYSSDFVVGEGRTCPSRLFDPRIIVSYQPSTDFWEVSVDTKLVGPPSAPEESHSQSVVAQPSKENIFSLGEQPGSLQLTEEHIKAAMMVLVLVACTIRRTRKSKVTQEDLKKQAHEFESAGIYGGRLCGYALSDFPRLHLSKESGYLRTVRMWLKGTGLNILSSSDYSTHSICWCDHVDSPRNHHHWVEVDPLHIRALPVHKRRGTSKFQEKLKARVTQG